MTKLPAPLLLSLAASFAVLAAPPEFVAPVFPGNVDAVTIGGGADWFATMSAPRLLNEAPSGRVAIQVWSLPQPVHLRTIWTSAASAIAAHPSRPMIAAARSNTIELIDVESGAIRTLNDHLSTQASRLAWSPDGSYLITGFDRMVRVDAQTGAETRINAALSPNKFIERIEFTDRDRVIVAQRSLLGDDPASVSLYDAGDWRELGRFEGPRGRIHIALDAKKTMLAAGGSEKKLWLWSLQPQKPLGSAIDLGEEPLALVFTSDGQSIAVDSPTKRVRVFDVATGSLRTTLQDDGYRFPLSATLVPGRDMVIGAGSGLNIMDGRLTRVLSTISASLAAHVSSVRFDKNGLALAWGGIGVEGTAWSLAPATQRIALQDSDHPIGFFVNGSSPGTPELAVRNDFTGIELRKADGVQDNAGIHDTQIFDGLQGITRDGRWIAGSNVDGTVSLIDTTTKTRHALPQKIANSILALSPAGNAVAVAEPPGASMRVHIWSLPELTETVVIDLKPPLSANSANAEPSLALPAGVGLEYAAIGMTFSADGKRLALLASGGALTLWNVRDGKVVGVRDADAGNCAIALNSDGSRAAIGNSNGRVTVWGVETPNAETVMDTGLPIDFLRFRDDDAQLLIGSPNQFSVRDPASGKLVGSFYLRTLDGPWVAFTDTGFFDGSEETWSEFVWRFDGNTFHHASAEAYFNDLFYPGIAARMLSGDLPPLPAGVESTDRNAPQLRLAVSAQPRTGERTIQLTLQAPAGSGLRDARVFRNGSLIERLDGPVPRDFKIPARLQAGRNVFTAWAFNSAKVRSEPATLTVEGGNQLARPGTLYVVAVGINDYRASGLNKLSYAVNDARMMAAVLRGGREQAIDWTRQVTNPNVNVNTAMTRRGSQAWDPKVWTASSGPAEIRVLADAEASRDAILKAIRDVAANALPEDAFIFFFAGHGAAAGDNYLILPQDAAYSGNSPAQLAQLTRSAISDRDLADALKNLDVAASALIIDACESGQAAKAADDWRRGPIDSNGLAQFAYEKNMLLLAASQSDQSARELQHLNHGLLTWALVEEGLREGRAAPYDLGTWLNWAAQRVPSLDAESISEKRGVLKPANQRTGGSATVQQPALMTRERPGALPLMISFGSVDLDPLTLTVQGTVSGPKTAPGGIFASRFLLPALSTGDVTSLGIGPRGEWIVTTEAAGAVRFWRPGDLLPFRSFTAPVGIVAAALSPDGTTLACLTEVSGILILDVQTGSVRSTTNGVRGSPYSRQRVLWSTDGRRLFAQIDNGIVVVDVASGRIATRVDQFAAALVWAAGDSMITRSPNGEIVQFDLNQPEGKSPSARKIGQHQGFGAAYDPARSLLLSASQDPAGPFALQGLDKMLRFWDVSRGAPLGDPIAAPIEVSTVLFADGVFYIAGESGDVYSIAGPGSPLVRTHTSGGRRFNFLASDGSILSAAGLSMAVWGRSDLQPRAVLSPDVSAQVVVLAGESLTIAGEQLASVTKDSVTADLFSYRATSQGVEYRSVKNAGKLMQASGRTSLIYDDGSFTRVFEPETLAPLATVPREAIEASASSDRSLLAWCVPKTGGAQGFDYFASAAANFDPHKVATSDTDSCGALDWLQTGDRPALARWYGYRLNIDPFPGGKGREFKIGSAAGDTGLQLRASPMAVAFDPTGATAAIATNESFQIIDTSTGEERRKPPLTFGPIRLVYSPDGRNLAAAGMTRQVALLALTATDTVTTSLAPVDGGVNALAFSGDGRILAALDGSGQCQIYDVTTGALLARVTPIEASQTLFVETPDGRFDAPRSAWPRIFRYDGERMVSLTEKAEGYTPGLLGQVIALRSADTVRPK